MLAPHPHTTAASELQTIIDFIRFGVTQAYKHKLYFGHGTDNVWDDMQALILGSLHLPLNAADIVLQSYLTTEEKQLLATQLQRRIIDKIPVPYLTNQAYFCELPFYVDERVLIPRSPFAELIRQQFAPWLEDTNTVTRILDLCTGSGCIAIACHYAFPEAIIDASDISADALAVARINCERHHTGNSINLIASDCWDNIPSQQYNLIVSNPPYVRAEEMQSLPREYQHEPQLALATDTNLSIIRQILAKAANYLTATGILVVEVGDSAQALELAYPNVPFTWVEFAHGGDGVFILTAQQLETYFA